MLSAYLRTANINFGTDENRHETLITIFTYFIQLAKETHSVPNKRINTMLYLKSLKKLWIFILWVWRVRKIVIYMDVHWYNFHFSVPSSKISSAHFVSFWRSNFPTSLRGIEDTNLRPPLIFLYSVTCLLTNSIRSFSVV